MAFGGLEDGQKGKAPMSDINVTPLVDVMLVLLVIFIITAPLMNSSIKLDLPKTAAAKSDAPSKPIKIAIDKKGDLFLAEKKLDLATFKLELQKQASATPSAEVQLRADEAVPYGKIVEVMGLANKAGLEKIGFVALQPTQ